MLYDRKWDKTTRTDPLSLGSLIAWLEKQPADEVYCYGDTGRCLLARYFSAMGFDDVLVGGHSFSHAGALDVKFPRHFNKIAVLGKWTFGAALQRARAVQTSAQNGS